MNNKFSVPELCKGAAIRENLLKELDDCNKSFFLSGAAGVGKTTLLCLYAKMKKNVFWYSADKSDNDLACFCRNFFARFVPFDDTEITTPFDFIKNIALNDFTVIIDDFENIKNNEVIRFLNEIMLYNDKNMRIFMASAHKIPAAFSDLCLKGKLTLIEDDDLAFSRNEAETAFGNEALSRYFDCDGAGVVLNSQNGVTPEMYYESFLAGLDESLKDFVVKSAFLFRIYPEICKTVFGVDDAQKMISKAKNLNTIAREDSGKLILTYGFRKFCEENFAETALRVRRSACDFCLENGKLKEAVLYCCVSREFDKISNALKNNLEAFFDSLTLEEIEIIAENLVYDDTYCKILKAYCDFRLKNNSNALSLIESVCENLDFLDSRKDRTSVLILKVEILNTLSKFGESYETILAAKATNKNFDSLLSLKTDILETDCLLRSQKYDESKKLCSDSATRAYVKGEYAYCDIYKLNLCRINLISGDFFQAQTDIKAIDFSRLPKIGVLNRLLIHTCILFDRKNLKDAKKEILENKDVLKLLNSDRKDIFKWFGIMLELEKAIASSNGKALSSENILPLLDVYFESKNRLIFLIFKKIIASIFANDENAIMTGLKFLNEYTSPSCNFFIGKEISICIALLAVMKKERIILNISELYDTKEKCDILYDDIFPVLVYVKAKFGDEYALYGDIYIERTLSSGAVLTYPIAYLNKAVIDYLDSKQKYSEIISTLLRISGAAPKIKIKTFGGIEIEGIANTDEVIKWRTAKTKELFAYFIHSGGEAISKAQIVADVFGVEDEKKATEIFNTTMYNLRKTVKAIFGDNIFTLSKGKYSIHLDGIAVDIISFRKCAADFAETGSISSALSIIKLYKGAYLKGTESDWVAQFANEYEQIFVNAAKSYLLSLKAENKTDTALEMCYIIHNEKCKTEEMTEFLNDYIKDLGIDADFK